MYNGENNSGHIYTIYQVSFVKIHSTKRTKEIAQRSQRGMAGLRLRVFLKQIRLPKDFQQPDYLS